MPRFVLALLLAISLVACSGKPGAGKNTTPFSAQLSITVWSKGKTGPSFFYSLTCPGGLGNLPAAASACAKLARLDLSAFAPVPPGTACTEIYGGPQIAQVSGYFAGETVDAVFDRSNGCEIERWQRLAFLFPTST